MKERVAPIKIKAAAIRTGDLRVWCAGCSIRISPNEEQIGLDGQTYHPRCYSKRFGAVPNGSGSKT